MLDLSNAQFLGKGSSRVCYVHPEDAGKCVKVIYTNHHEIMEEELKFYRRYVRRRISWDMLARWHGVVETSIGAGAVFSLARDFDGAVSRPLDLFFKTPVDESLMPQLRVALQEFRTELFKGRIVVRELKPDNLVYQRLTPDAGKLVLIDGVGNNQFLPVATYSPLFARLMLKKKWAKFQESLKDAGGGTILS